MTSRIALIANFHVEHSTGNDLKDTLERMGAVVDVIQEEDERAWGLLIGWIKAGHGPDAVIWNRTPTLAARIPLPTRLELLETAKKARIPTIAFHLDRWWGLKREHEVFDDPYFQCAYVFTADGHDPERWKAAGVRHFWSPPAIAPRNLSNQRLNVPIRAEIVFIGTQWRYHEEWTHRDEMIRWLRRYFGKRFMVLPSRNHPQVRGEALTRRIAASKVLIGDSCLVSDGLTPYTRYFSDRIPETLGRGGFLVHPSVDGVTDGSLYTSGTHLATWQLGDWHDMRRVVARYLEADGERRQIRDQGFEHVKANHTYRQRLERVFEVVGWM